MNKRINKRFILIGIPVIIVLIVMIVVLSNWYQASASPNSSTSSQAVSSEVSSTSQSFNLTSSQPTLTSSSVAGSKATVSENTAVSSQTKALVKDTASSKQSAPQKRADGVIKITADRPIPNTGRHSSYTLTSSEVDQFMKLYNNVKMELVSQDSAGPGAGELTYNVNIFYADREDRLALPDFFIIRVAENKSILNTYQTSSGTEELMKYVNSLKIFKDVDISAGY